MPGVQKYVQTAAEVASAMAFLHSKDVLHSDLSSSNVLLSKQAAEGGQEACTVAKVGSDVLPPAPPPPSHLVPPWELYMVCARVWGEDCVTLRAQAGCPSHGMTLQLIVQHEQGLVGQPCGLRSHSVEFPLTPGCL